MSQKMILKFDLEGNLKSVPIEQMGKNQTIYPNEPKYAKLEKEMRERRAREGKKS